MFEELTKALSKAVSFCLQYFLCTAGLLLLAFSKRLSLMRVGFVPELTEPVVGFPCMLSWGVIRTRSRRRRSSSCRFINISLTQVQAPNRSWMDGHFFQGQVNYSTKVTLNARRRTGRVREVCMRYKVRRCRCFTGTTSIIMFAFLTNKSNVPPFAKLSLL